MKKTISILFVLIYLLAETETAQLLKLPVLFQHFAEHKRENKDVNFLAFLHNHYLQGNKKNSDYDSDMKLPFKKLTFAVSAISHICIPPPNCFAIVCPVTKVEPMAITTPDLFTPYSILSSIWQPPRMG